MTADLTVRDPMTLAAAARSVGTPTFSCVPGTDLVTLRLTFALLAQPGRPEQSFRVPPEQFRSPTHRLNRGYLQRFVEHANQCHQEELRRAVATTTGTRLSQVVGVSLAGLRPDRVEVQWVDLDGAHSRTLAFPRAATSTEELGELLRRELHAGLC